MSAVGRNALCPCGSGRKYKLCCLNAGDASKPHTGQDAVIVLMPTRGQICVETQLALENNMNDVPHVIGRVARKPIVEARNALARFALHLQRENPFVFTPCEWFALWVDDDAWFPPGLPATALRCMREMPMLDALFGCFGGRMPYSPIFARRRRDDPESFPKVGVDCKPGEVIEIARAGFHFVLMRLSLLERVGPNPFDTTADKSEDFAFCDRAKGVGARLGVGTGFPIIHIDPRDGMAYQVGMPAAMMDGNSVRSIPAFGHAGKLAEKRSYGGVVDELSRKVESAAPDQEAELAQRREVSAVS